MIAPVGEKLLFEHTKFSATRGGDLPRHHHPGSATDNIHNTISVNTESKPCKVPFLVYCISGNWNSYYVHLFHRTVTFPSGLGYIHVLFFYSNHSSVS